MENVENELWLLILSFINRASTPLLREIEGRIKVELEHRQELLNAKLNDNEMNLVRNGEIIEAVKSVRARTGFYLRDAKIMVDRYRDEIKP